METNETLSKEQTTSSPERIGFGKRLGAYILDIVAAGIGGGIIGVFAGTALAALFFATEMGEGMDEAEALGGGIMGIIGGALGTIAGMMLVILLIMLLEAFTGQTIGKMILGIKNGNQDGTPSSTGTLITRAAIKYIGTIMAVLAGITGISMIGSLGSLAGLIVFIGFFFILGDKKQGFHDMIAKTAVFNKSDLS